MIASQTRHRVGKKRKPLVISDEGQKVKAASAQLPADIVYWLNVAATIEGISVARLVDPILREFSRSKVKACGIDPDEAWQKRSEKSDSDPE